MKKPKTSPRSLITIEQISTEREIAELQLARIKEIARTRLLSYEETKIYDILTKNLLLAKGDPTVINATSKVVDEVPAEDVNDLLEIAQTQEDDIRTVLNFVEANTDVGKKETPDK